MSFRTALADVLHGAVDLVFAPICLGCGGPISPAALDRLVCPACWSRLRQIPLPRCDRCWTPRPPAPTADTARTSCGTCDQLPPSLRTVRSPFLMDGPARLLVHAIKYQGWSAVAGPMARKMAAVDFPVEVREEVRLVVPVPIAAVRLRERGYNQAELLARELAARRGLAACPEILTRSRATRSQTTLLPEERRANVAGAFSVRSGLERVVRREHILLVDDVWTTGATALACAAALTEAGARAISVLTFARAIPGVR